MSLHSTNNFGSHLDSATASLKILHITDSRQQQRRAPPIALIQSPIVNICEAPLMNMGLDNRAATAAASAPTEMSTLSRMIKPRVWRSLCVHEGAHLTPSADSRSACEPSGNATVPLLVNKDFKSTNCSRCHAAQTGRCGGQRAQHKQSCRSAVALRPPAGLLLWLLPGFRNGLWCSSSVNTTAVVNTLCFIKKRNPSFSS